MRDKLQGDYKKIISYVLVAVAVLSVLIAGVLAIKKVHSVELKEYQVHGQFEDIYPPGAVNEPDSYAHEFLCVSEDMAALLIRGQIWEGSAGTVWYCIEDAQGNVLRDSVEEIQSMRRDGYDGIWIDVSSLGLQQGERYKLTASYAWTSGVLVNFGDFKISVAQVFEYDYAWLYTVVVIGLMALAFVWLYLVYKKGYSTRAYIITTLVLGMITIVLMPPANRDDEYRHFLRGYVEVKNISAVMEVPKGGESGLIGDSEDGEFMVDVPYEINELRLMGYDDNHNGYEYKSEINEFLCIDKVVALLKSEPVEETKRVSIAGVILKDTTSYWPQILSMKVADFFGARDLVLYYAARLGQLLVCLIMEVAAMKLAPKMKEMIWLLAFIPNAFLLKVSCNPDGLMTAEILLLAAIVIWLKEEKIDVFSRKGVVGSVLFLLLSYSIMRMKLPYILISLGLLVYLEKDNIAKLKNWITEHKKQSRYIVAAIVVFAVIGIALGKNAILGMVYSFLPETHITYMLAHPSEIAGLFFEKWGFMCVNLVSGMNGEFIIPYAIFVIAILAMMKKELPVFKRIWFGVLFGILIMVIVLAGYSLSPADYGTIEEIGYRYLLPFLVVGAIALPSGTKKTEKCAKQLMPLAIFVTMTTTMITWIVGWSV